MAEVTPPTGTPGVGGVAQVYQPIEFREADSYLVFAVVSLVPPRAATIPVKADPLVVIDSSELALTVCGVEFDEAVLTIGGKQYTASNVQTPARSCRLLTFNFTPPEYKCKLSDIEVGSCNSVAGCVEAPRSILIYVSTTGKWVAVRSKPATWVTGSGNAFVAADYICFEESGSICETRIPSDCCYTVEASLSLRKSGNVVAFTRFNVLLCAFTSI